MKLNLCSCGSGKPRTAVCDARGIFVTYVCDDCRQRKLQMYRPEIFTDPNYATWEDIESDDGSELKRVRASRIRDESRLTP